MRVNGRVNCKWAIISVPARYATRAGQVESILMYSIQSSVQFFPRVHTDAQNGRRCTAIEDDLPCPHSGRRVACFAYPPPPTLCIRLLGDWSLDQVGAWRGTYQASTDKELIQDGVNQVNRSSSHPPLPVYLRARCAIMGRSL